jgi:endonuclease/exonuclease/phosphatase family metal-dependent hydrolase
MERPMNRIAIPLLAFVLAMAGCDEDLITDSGIDQPVAPDQSSNSAVKLKVMTRNMYIGADVDKVIEATDVFKIPVLVEEAWQTMQATDFPSRAEAIAREIEASSPHLVGLQEVYLIRTQAPADLELNAETVAFDFLETLLSELEELGTDYRVVGQVENSDVEMPRLNRQEGMVDVRVTDYDVVLARGDVEIGNVVAGNYQASFPVQSFEIKRGYIVAEATVEEMAFRFVNTHPEPASTAEGYFQDLQVKELLEMLESDPQPTVLVGDLNTPAPMSPIYAYFIEAGYEDVWTSFGDKASEGLTCCHATTLDNTDVSFHERIDLILVNHLEGLVAPSGKLTGFVEIVGEELADRTSTGVWPSDHAGLVAEIVFPRPGR